MDAPPVQYVRTSDAYNIAYSVTGRGMPFVLVAGHMPHLPVWDRPDSFMFPWLEGLARRYQVVTYDGRGQGYSSRGLTEAYCLDDDVADLTAVVQQLGFDHFVLMTGVHAGIRYALSNPKRVSGLVINRMPAAGSSWSEGLMYGVPRDNWELFLSTIAGVNNTPDHEETVRWLRRAVNKADWLKRARAVLDSDITDVLPRLTMPVLVLHPRGDSRLPLEESVALAGLIPEARLAVLDGDSALGDHSQGLTAIADFIAARVGVTAQTPERGSLVTLVELSARQREVLRLIAQGKTTRETADELVLSARTVERHIADIYARLNFTNRAQAAVYAKDHGLT